MQKESFARFMAYYRGCHSNRRNQWLHFAGATLFVGCTIAALATARYWLLPVGVLLGYLLPHIGHQHCEGNRSLRASHPVYCVLGAGLLYLGMWGQLLQLVLGKRVVRLFTLRNT
jgi:hypothetical protein